MITDADVKKLRSVFATKEDIGAVADSVQEIKVRLDVLEDNLTGEIAKLHDENLITSSYRREIDDHEERIAVLEKSAGGQAALILIMIMAVIGVVSVSVAARSVENLRTQEISNTSSQAQGAANAGLELAQSLKVNIPQTQLGGNSSYSATYNLAGGDGFVTDSVNEGDVVQASLVGAVGVSSINVYWNTNAAVFVSLLSGNTVSGSYTVGRYSGDPDAARRGANKLTAVTSGAYSFKGGTFGNRITVPINLAANPAPQMLRVTALYQTSSVGIEPVGGTLANGQVVTINSTGTSQNNVVTKISLSKFSERVPAVFDNVLYTSGNLAQ